MNIEIYGMSFCQACEDAMFFLDQVGTPYRYFNVEEMQASDLTLLMKRIAPESRTVPIILIDNREVTYEQLVEYFKNRTTTKLGDPIVHEEKRGPENDAMHDQLGSHPSGTSPKTE